MGTEQTLKALVISPDASIRQRVRSAWASFAGECCDAESLDGVPAALEWDQLDLLVCDGSGVDEPLAWGCARLRRLAPQAILIWLAAAQDWSAAAAALAARADDCLLLPISPEAVRLAVLRSQRLRGSEQRALQLDHLAAIGQRMTVLTHESRNILQLMQANLELTLRRMHDRPQEFEYLQRVQRSQDQLQMMFEDLRNYAAPLLLRREPVDLGQLLEQVADRVANSRKRDLQLHQQRHAPSLICSVDPFRFDQVFRNLLENALDAVPGPVSIWTDWQPARLDAAPALQVTLRDNGPGLSPEQRQKAFTPFFTTKPQGTGLGMAIARRIVEAHGGELQLGDGAGRGGEFVLRLPLAWKTAAPLYRTLTVSDELPAFAERLLAEVDQ